MALDGMSDLIKKYIHQVEIVAFMKYIYFAMISNIWKIPEDTSRE